MDLTNIRNTLTEIYELQLTNGLTAYFTPHSTNITYLGRTYQSIPMSRSNIAYHSNLQADKVDITMGVVGVIIGGNQLTIPQIIKRGYFRYMRVRILLLDYVALANAVVRFDGYLTGGISYDQGTMTISVGSILDKLNDKFPKLVYSEYCQHKLFDTRCGLSKASYSQNGVVGANSTVVTIYSTVFAYSNRRQGWWVRGELLMTSGNNDTISRMVVEHFDGYVTLITPFPEEVETDDTFTVYWGCDRTGQTCANKFNNYANFFGFEYIPKPEMILY